MSFDFEKALTFLEKTIGSFGAGWLGLNRATQAGAMDRAIANRENPAGRAAQRKPFALIAIGFHRFPLAIPSSLHRVRAVLNAGA